MLGWKIQIKTFVVSFLFLCLFVFPLIFFYIIIQGGQSAIFAVSCFVLVNFIQVVVLQEQQGLQWQSAVVGYYTGFHVKLELLCQF